MKIRWISPFIFAVAMINYTHTKNIIVHIDPKHVIDCEVAQDPSAVQKGLMFRKHLTAHQGMLFIFPQSSNWSFWMKNTLIPLDIIWLDANKTVLYISKNTPPCPKDTLNCPTYTPPTYLKAKYVLEIAQGQSERLNIYPQQHLQF